ncbi:HEXXH motif-containing putative peptide modification protein [Actinokineospora sp. NBRC 105648]|uniref:aKG-HExxH-type peptide beta-hydroxylase n=1 Tax=Actinokineospora sp. NBRC 105648 TaxID=3032206 RepID=UPI00249FBDD9|nr:HEXXH motif-containing putative peptide modification protein [Actinokineospora sp. NBRC 105648]GLZ41971.1 HEXXH motif domain-containing protein [Actinokineospora sp. NBRC 105648]
MTPQLFALAPGCFERLARGGGGVACVRALVSARRSRTLAAIRLAAIGDDRGRRAYDLLAALGRQAPGAVRRVLDDPVVGAWATQAVLDGSRAAELGFVAAAAAVRAGVPVEVDLPRGGHGVLPSLGSLTGVFGGPARTDLLQWKAFPVIGVGGGVAFTIATWPAGILPPGLELAAEVDLPACAALLRAAWDLVTRTDPRRAAELAAVITTLTPMPARSTRTNSATVPDALGCVFLTFNADPESLAVTLAHEAQHAKLAALMDIHPLVEVGGATRYYAPWRDDPRPAVGLLHGVYAFLGVTGFWRRRRLVAPGAHADREFARWRSAALGAARTLLAGDDLTAHGRRFAHGGVATLRECCGERVPGDTATDAARALADHRRRWLARHGH